MKKEKKNKEAKETSIMFNNKIFGIAAYSGIGIIILVVLGMIISSLLKGNPALSSAWSIVQGILILFFGIIFAYGFYSLGKKYKSNFLKVVSAITIIFAILTYIVNLFVVSPMAVSASNIAFDKIRQSGIDPASMTPAQSQAFVQVLLSDATFMSLIINILVLFLIYIAFLIVISILFGIGLLKIKDKVKYAKTAGILGIVGGATAIILLGFIAMIVAFVYKLIILFNESKK
jgi:hypothetical protein